MHPGAINLHGRTFRETGLDRLKSPDRRRRSLEWIDNSILT
jgi:hypothetical protein